MATTIKLKNSVTTTAAPSSLVQGEVAANITDKKVWIGDASSSPVQILGAGAPVSGTTGTFTGNTTVAGTFAANGGATLGDASGDALTINSSAVSIPNGLNFDSNTFVIDATNNYVGVGTASPSEKLYIVTDSAGGGIGIRTNTSGDPYVRFLHDTNIRAAIYSNRSSGNLTIETNTGTNYPIIFSTNSTERMRITSTGNVGIGSSTPSSTGIDTGATQLYVVAPNSNYGATLTLLSDANGRALRFADQTKTYVGGLSVSSSGVSVGSTSASTPLLLTTGGNTRVTIDSSGNLGLGVTPSAWASGGGGVAAAIQLGGTAYGSGSIYNTYGSTYISSNVYFDGTNWKRIAAGFGTQVQVDAVNGKVNFNLAGFSGTVGSTATFTQAMTLDASGRLGIGTTSPSTQLEIKSPAFTDSEITLDNTSSNTTSRVLFKAAGTEYGRVSGDATQVTLQAANIPMVFRVNSAERMRIDSSGNLLVGKTDTTFNTAGARLSSSSNEFTVSGGKAIAVNRTTSDGAIIEMFRQGSSVGSISVTSSATAYNTSSDYRLKNNQAPLTGSGAFIDALQPKTWTWTADGSTGVGFIAHEVQAVSPNSVTGEKDAVDEEGNPQYQAMEYGSAEFIANIIAELQDLRKRVAVLESK
jgi:hypothetical protein